uniref:Claudin n=1 Tax=Mola mola TaxID=94237 RepID=A0A3Q3XDI9_MOLML
MRKRLIQIFGFLITSLGWVFVLCTMAMDYWRITQLGGQGGSFIIKVAWYWSNLWKDCFTDSTAITNCRDFPVLWGVRGLLMCGITLGFFAVVLCFVGMDCTYIGGTDKTKDKLLFAGAVFHFVGGLCSLSAFPIYAHQITSEFFDTNFMEQKYEQGAALFIGRSGSFLHIIGRSIFCFSIAGCRTKSHSHAIYIYKGAASCSHISSYPRGQAETVNLRPPQDYSDSSRM